MQCLLIPHIDTQTAFTTSWLLKKKKKKLEERLWTIQTTLPLNNFQCASSVEHICVCSITKTYEKNMKSNHCFNQKDFVMHISHDGWVKTREFEMAR